MGLNTEKCSALVERDKKVIAPCQHLSYYPLAVAKVDGGVRMETRLLIFFPARLP